MEKALKYRRILLKLSGEALSGPDGFGIDPNRAEDIAERIEEVRDLGVDVAIVIGADVLIKATKVDGVYDSDPMTNPDAVRFDELSYMEAINRRLEVMDSTAISLCMDNHLPILVLNLWKNDDLRKSLFGEKVGTLVSG